MAVNKRFVVKTGIEVSDDLIYAESGIDKVGLGITTPGAKLHVVGNIIGAGLTLSGSLDASNSVFTGIVTTNDGLYVGAGGTALHVDVTNNLVGVGTSSPDTNYALTVTTGAGQSAATLDGSLDVQGNTWINGDLSVNGAIDGTFTVNLDNPIITGVVTANNAEIFTQFDIINNSNLAYQFQSTGIGFTQNKDNPTLFLNRGQKYHFNLDASGHPFYIKTAATTGTGNQYTNGVTNNGAQVGIITFYVPYNAPSELFYQCGSHSGMGNTMYVVKDAPPADVAGPIVTNILYVTKDGNDSNTGQKLGAAKATIKSAVAAASEGTVIKISAGNYQEDNPIILPEQVTLLGDSLREISIIPQNPDEDLIYVANGSYVENLSFTGSLNEGKAIIAFNPEKPSFVTQGPYVRNCTNFISNSIGMKIDGKHVIGATKAMNVDSYTQLNQGGIGVSISNEGYAQLVSIFTIYNDQSIVCINGGQCDLTNSNSSFGRLGLVADGIGARQFLGIVTTAAAADSRTFTLNVGVGTLGITTADYTASTGIITITTNANHGFNEGQSVDIRDLEFQRSSGPGIVTFPSGNYGHVFTVDAVGAANSFSAYVGVSTLVDDYVRAGVTSTFVTRPYDGQVVYLDELYNTISGVTITNGGSGYTSPPVVTFSSPSEPWGITATGVARITNGVVTSIDMISNGRGYTGTPTVNIDGTATGTPDILPKYYVVSSSTPIVGGISTVTFTENVPYAVGVGTTVPFFKQSRVLASSHAFEYIGSGNQAITALPQRGGVTIPENEVISQNGGLVIYTSTDQAGNFKIGDGVTINQLEGSITGDAYERSLFATVTPYILALGGDS